jgi:hypothetical protein
MDAVHAAAERGTILGFGPWLGEMVTRYDLNLAFELREALRLFGDGEPAVRLDNDCVRKPDGAASIDLLAVDPATKDITRSVEVMGYPRTLTSYETFFEAVKQGADHLISKLQRKAGRGARCEATVAVQLAPAYDYRTRAATACAALDQLADTKLIDGINLVNRSDGRLCIWLQRTDAGWCVSRVHTEEVASSVGPSSVGRRRSRRCRG